MSEKVIQRENFSVLDAGKWEDLHQVRLTEPIKARGKLFLKDIMGLTGMEVSLNVFPAGVSMPFHHKHKENEELYIVVQGSGQFQIDGEIFDVQEGTVIRVTPSGVRTWRNHSSEDLYFICIQAKENSLTSSTVSDGVVLSEPVEWDI